MSVTNILLADDHRIVRQGFRALLEAEPDFHIVAETGDGLEAIRLVDQFKPHVLVVDLMMPSLNGLEVVRQLTQRAAATRIVVLSMHANEAYVSEALRNGASAYVLKDSSFADLVRAVREVLAGRRYLSPPLSQTAIDIYLQKTRKADTLDIYDTLTNREREVLHLAAEGHTNIEIGAKLFISPRTVETHRANVMHKLGLHSQAELIRYALQRGVVAIEGKLPRDQ